MSSTEVHRAATTESSGETDPLVDPRAPRVGQAITTVGLLAGIALQQPILIYLVAVVLIAAVVTRWRVDGYALVFRTVVAPRLTPADREPAAPHRFARLLGAIGTGLASILLIVGLQTSGYVVAVGVAAAAGLAAGTGLCLGCKLYGQVAFFRRLGVV